MPGFLSKINKIQLNPKKHEKGLVFVENIHFGGFVGKNSAIAHKGHGQSYKDSRDF